MKYCTLCEKKHRKQTSCGKRSYYYGSWDDLNFSKLSPEQKSKILVNRIKKQIGGAGFDIKDMKRTIKKLCSYGEKK